MASRPIGKLLLFEDVVLAAGLEHHAPKLFFGMVELLEAVAFLVEHDVHLALCILVGLKTAHLKHVENHRGSDGILPGLEVGRGGNHIIVLQDVAVVRNLARPVDARQIGKTECVLLGLALLHPPEDHRQERQQDHSHEEEESQYGIQVLLPLGQRIVGLVGAFERAVEHDLERPLLHALRIEGPLVEAHQQDDVM